MDEFIERLASSLSRADLIEISLKNAVIHALITSQEELALNDKQFANLLGISEYALFRLLSGERDCRLSQVAKMCAKCHLVPRLHFELEDGEDGG